MDFENLISRCIAKMEEENLTNKDVAQIAKISEATVSRTLASRGANATAATIAAICAALGVSSDAAQYKIVDRSRSKDEVYELCIEQAERRADREAREKRAISIAFLIAVAFIFTLFTIDLLNPNVGWFRG